MLSPAKSLIQSPWRHSLDSYDRTENRKQCARESQSKTKMSGIQWPDHIDAKHATLDDGSRGYDDRIVSHVPYHVAITLRASGSVTPGWRYSARTPQNCALGSLDRRQFGPCGNGGPRSPVYARTYSGSPCKYEVWKVVSIGTRTGHGFAAGTEGQCALQSQVDIRSVADLAAQRCPPGLRESSHAVRGWLATTLATCASIGPAL